MLYKTEETKNQWARGDERDRDIFKHTHAIWCVGEAAGADLWDSLWLRRTPPMPRR